MKFRTKLYLILVALAFACVTIGLVISYFQMRKLFLGEFRSKALSIAATTASLLDPEVLKKINNPSDAFTKEFADFREALRKARNNNQRKDVFVIYMYTLRPSHDDPKKLVILVSAANTPEETSPIGTPFISSISKEIAENITSNYTPKKFKKDQWGTWLSAFVPIFDANGKYVATLGIDISAEDIEYQLFALIKIVVYAFTLTFSLAMFSAFFLAKSITHSLSTIRESIQQISQGDFEQRPHLKTRDEFRELADSISEMAEGLKERDKLKVNFAKYVSSHVLEKTLSLEYPNKIEGERKKITVVFCGIRNFLKLTETLSAEDVVSILNQYFAKMLEIVFKNHGTLDKFISGGMMVEFGAPKDDPNQEKNAILAALEMHKALKTLAKKWNKEGKPVIEIGIGIHTGLAVVGNIGSEKRMEYTAIGDSVNVASRLEVLSQELGETILVSETTYSAIKDKFPFTSLGLKEIIGRKEGINLYAIRDKS